MDLIDHLTLTRLVLLRRHAREHREAADKASERGRLAHEAGLDRGPYDVRASVLLAAAIVCEDEAARLVDAFRVRSPL